MFCALLCFSFNSHCQRLCSIVFLISVVDGCNPMLFDFHQLMGAYCFHLLVHHKISSSFLQMTKSFVIVVGKEGNNRCKKKHKDRSNKVSVYYFQDPFSHSKISFKFLLQFLQGSNCV